MSDLGNLELDKILTLEWPRVVRCVMGDTNTDDFTRGFVRSIARHGKRPEWRPSFKQERLMRLMLRDYSGQPEPYFDPIERD